MNLWIKRPLTLFLSLVFLVFVGFVVTKIAERIRIAEMYHTLGETRLETGDFLKPMKLGKMLDLLTERCAAQGRNLPIRINFHAFEENSDVQEFLKGCQEPAMLDTEVRFPQFPKKMTVATILRLLVTQMKPCATYMMCAEGVEITPFSADPSLRVYPVSGLVIPTKTWGELMWEKLIRFR